tara:strand:+ start:136 stop:357 length:222 start_codon:yes stop_codon:yes gene_type:complete
MKFILAFSICSAISGYCNTTAIVPVKFDSWSECVMGGSQLTIEYVTKMEEKINKDKLYITYFCNEDHSNKTPA